ncbi:hypothetical protein LJR143_004231 [Pseudoxanthomonas sp. LjRoot143]
MHSALPSLPQRGADGLGGAWKMHDRSIPTKVLLTETARLIPRFLLVFVALSLAYAIAGIALGHGNVLHVVAALFWALIFFAALLTASSVRARRGTRLLTPAGIKTLLFCSAWGAIVVAGFIATLQVWQGMGATLLNYAAAVAAGGAFCALMATIPNR